MLFVRGAGWHKGVIGLVAGRLNRKFSVPVCALSEEDGLLHGSLRGVPGVNLAACLRACDDLLVKYGGHEMAAGVTLTEANYAAFCARLEDAVRNSAGPEAFVPAQAYDIRLNLEDADVSLIAALEKLHPFGTGHPAPVFFTGGAILESRRACGAGDAHLQIRLRQNKTVLGGIAFGMGGDAALLPDAVDVAYSLERNEFRGKTDVQCHVAAIRPDAYARRRALAAGEDAPYLDSLARRLVSQAGKPVPCAENLQPAKPPASWLTDDLLQGCQGTLYVAYAKDSAAALLSRLEDRVDVAWETVVDPRCFHTLLLVPSHMAELSPHWRRVVLLDGALSPADLARWQAQCGRAALIELPRSQALRTMLTALDAGDDGLRELYRCLRKSSPVTLQEAALAAGLTRAQTLAGLWAFHEMELISLTLNPFSYALLPSAKRSLDESALLRLIRAAPNLRRNNSSSPRKEVAGC